MLRLLPAGRTLRLRLAVRVIESYAARRTGEPLRVLDAGSEEGPLATALVGRHPNWFVVAADLSLPALQRGRSRVTAGHPPVSYVQADLTRFLGDAVYDVVVSVESIVEIPDDAAAIRRLVEALAPGGLMYIQVPVLDWTPALPGAKRTWRHEARHGYDADELERRLVSAGLRIVSVTPTFHRLAALCEDVNDRGRARRRAVRLLLLPFTLAAVRLELAGLRIGKPRAVVVVAVKPARDPAEAPGRSG
jgi:trans-aconitate methyltransferase